MFPDRKMDQGGKRSDANANPPDNFVAARGIIERAAQPNPKEASQLV